MINSVEHFTSTRVNPINYKTVRSTSEILLHLPPLLLGRCCWCPRLLRSLTPSGCCWCHCCCCCSLGGIILNCMYEGAKSRKFPRHDQRGFSSAASVKHLITLIHTVVSSVAPCLSLAMVQRYSCRVSNRIESNALHIIDSPWVSGHSSMDNNTTTTRRGTGESKWNVHPRNIMRKNSITSSLGQSVIMKGGN